MVGTIDSDIQSQKHEKIQKSSEIAVVEAGKFRYMVGDSSFHSSPETKNKITITRKRRRMRRRMNTSSIK